MRKILSLLLCLSPNLFYCMEHDNVPENLDAWLYQPLVPNQSELITEFNQNFDPLGQSIQDLSARVAAIEKNVQAVSNATNEHINRNAEFTRYSNEQLVKYIKGQLSSMNSRIDELIKKIDEREDQMHIIITLLNEIKARLKH
jgi:methyl-accepting chemotaxis protein